MCIHKKNKEINKALKLLKTVILDETISTIYKSNDVKGEPSVLQPWEAKIWNERHNKEMSYPVMKAAHTKRDLERLYRITEKLLR